MTGSFFRLDRTSESPEYAALRQDAFNKIFYFVLNPKNFVEKDKSYEIEFHEIIAMEIKKLLLLHISEIEGQSPDASTDYDDEAVTQASRFISANFNFGQSDDVNKLDALCFDVAYLLMTCRAIFAHHNIDTLPYLKAIEKANDTQFSRIDLLARAKHVVDKGGLHYDGDGVSATFSRYAQSANIMSVRARLRDRTNIGPLYINRDETKYPTAESFLKGVYDGRLGAEGDLHQALLRKLNSQLMDALNSEFSGDRRQELRHLLPTKSQRIDGRLQKLLGYVPKGAERKSAVTVLGRGHTPGVRRR